MTSTSTEEAPRALSRLDILHGLRLSTWEASFSTVHAALTTGAFLTGFALWLGADSVTMGLLTAIPTFAGLVQIVASYLSERLSERRKFTAGFATAGRVLWLPILLLPLALPRSAALWPFLLLFALSFLLLNIPIPAWMSWMSDLVPPDHRGRYFARRNMIAGIVGMVVALPAAWFLDYATKRHHWETFGFGTLFGLAVLAGLASCLCLLRQPEPPKQRTEDADEPRGVAGVLDYYRAPFADPNFRRLMVFNALLSIGQFFAAPFFTVYALERLHLDYTWLQVFATLSSLASLGSMPLWGFLADKVGNRALLAIGVFGVITLPISWVFTTPHKPALTLLLLTEVNLAGGLFWGGVGLTQFNLLIQASPPRRTAVYVATMAAIVGLTGGLAPLAGGVLMRMLQGWHGQLFGMTLDNFRVAFLVAALMRLVALLFLRPVQEARATSTRDVLQQLSRARPRAWLQMRHLQEGSQEARLRATEALAETRTQLAVGELQGALTDPSADVRYEAAHALGVIGDPASVSFLIAALDDPVPEVVEEAVRALGHIGDREANAALIPLLWDDKGVSARRVRLAAARALGALGGPEAVDALRDILRAAQDDELKEAAARSLGEIGDRRAAPELIACLQEGKAPRSLRLTLIRSLGEIGEESARDLLRAILAEPDAEAALLPPLADALARLKDTPSVLPLLDKLPALDSPVARRQVAYSIGQLLDMGKEVYNLLAREEFARDAAVSKSVGEMQRSLRSLPAAEPTLRAALESYTAGDYPACLRSLEQVAQLVAASLPLPAFDTDRAPYRDMLQHLVGPSAGNVPLETVLLAFSALSRLVGTGGRAYS